MVTAVTTHTSYSPEHQAKGDIEVSPASRGPAPPEVAARASGAGDRSQEQPGDTTGSGDTTGNGFEQFWQAYPKKEGRAAAKKQFAEVVGNGVALATLVAKAKQYAMAKAEVDPKWLKTPANWLRDEGWLEDPQPPRQRMAKAERGAKAKNGAGKAGNGTAKAKERVGKAKAPSNVVTFPKAAVEKPERPEKPKFQKGAMVWHTERETLGEIVDTESVRGNVRVKWLRKNGDPWLEWVPRSKLSAQRPKTRSEESAGFKLGATVRDKYGRKGKIVKICEGSPFDVLVEWRYGDGYEGHRRDDLAVLPDAPEDSPFKVGALVCPKNNPAQRAKIIQVSESDVVMRWRDTGEDTFESKESLEDQFEFLGQTTYRSEKESA
jgi:hypothetical protein